MKKCSKIQKILHEISPKNDREMFSALIYLALIFFETDNYEGIECLAKDYYGQLVSKGRGFSNPDSKFSPSVVFWRINWLYA